MSAGRRENQVVGTDVPVDVVDVIEELHPGDTALIYLAGPGHTPGAYAPVDVIDVVDVIDEVQPGDTALIYRAGPVPSLVTGTVESVMAAGRKRPAHHITFTAPLTDDPGSAQLSVTPHVTPESNHVFIRAYRVNQLRAERRARQATNPAADDDTPAAYPSAPRLVPEPSIVSGVIGSVVPWGLTWPGHLITYTAPVIDDGSYQFPVNRTSTYAFISAYRAHTT
jgi:hypothetical protein